MYNDIPIGRIVKSITKDKSGNKYEPIIENSAFKGYKLNDKFYHYNKIIENEDDVRLFKLYIDRKECVS